MFFFTLSNIKVNFFELKFFLKTYTFIKAIPTIKQIKQVERKKFAAVTLDPKKKIT